MAKLYTFDCTFNVVKHDGVTMTDMEFAQYVRRYLIYDLCLAPHKKRAFHVIEESIHPIMVGPEGGVDIEE